MFPENILLFFKVKKMSFNHCMLFNLVTCLIIVCTISTLKKISKKKCIARSSREILQSGMEK